MGEEKKKYKKLGEKGRIKEKGIGREKIVIDRGYWERNANRREGNWER